LQSIVTGYDSSKREKYTTKKELPKNKTIAMDLILEGLYDSIKTKWVNVHQLKDFEIGYMISILHPSQNPENVKEDVGIDQEAICSSCQTNSEDEEYIINKCMLFFFNYEKGGHIEMECREGTKIE
jgi:hypothetical protein